MNDSNQNQTGQGSAANNNTPNVQADNFTSQTPVTSSDDLFPPNSPNSTVRAMVGGRLITTTLGVFLLVAGLAAGVLLVRQPQLLNQKAQTVNYDICSDSICDVSTYPSSLSTTQLTNGLGCYDNYSKKLAYCCPIGSIISGDKCVAYCTNIGNTGAICTDGCPVGKAAYIFKNADCSTYCNSGLNGANCTVTTPFVIIGSDNPNATANSCDEVCGRQTSATKTSTCISVGLNTAANDSKYKTVTNGACNILSGASCGYTLKTLSRSCGGVKKETTKCKCMLTTK